MKIRCITIDDEPWALQQMERYIKEVPFLELTGSFSNPVESLEFIKSGKTDLIFLDIQMENLSGIKLMEVLKDPPAVIFTTAYDEYAIKGYDLDVVDYLLKPISFERFLKAANKAYDRLKKTDQASGQIIVQTDDNNYFFIKSGSSIVKLHFADILFIEGMKDYIRIHTRDKKVMVLMSFLKIIKILPETDFCRIHKSYIISMDKIESIEGNIVKINEHKIPVGRIYKQGFLELIERKGIN